MFQFPNYLFKDLGLELESNKKTQSTLELSLKYSDKVYIFDNGNIDNGEYSIARSLDGRYSVFNWDDGDTRSFSNPITAIIKIKIK